MLLNKKRSRDIFLILLKIFCLIVGLDIFLTTVLKIIKEEFNKNNLESVLNLNIKDLEYEQNFQFDKDIY